MDRCRVNEICLLFTVRKKKKKSWKSQWHFVSLKQRRVKLENPCVHHPPSVGKLLKAGRRVGISQVNGRRDQGVVVPLTKWKQLCSVQETRVFTFRVFRQRNAAEYLWRQIETHTETRLILCENDSRERKDNVRYTSVTPNEIESGVCWETKRMEFVDYSNIVPIFYRIFRIIPH